MMSFGGGWFFLAASESISVLNRQYTLPGLGSYVAAAIAAKDMRALGYAVGTMILLILLIDQFFWKPLVNMADRYKLELSAGEEQRFWVVELWRNASLPRRIESLTAPLWQAADRWLSQRTAAVEDPPPEHPTRKSDLIFHAIVVVFILALLIAAVHFVLHGVGGREVAHAAILGVATGARVLVLIIFSTLVWTPIGVAIRLSPRLARITQPLVH